MAIKKITVLYGGQSSEREVSLESGKDIYHSLKALGYEAQLIDYPKNFFIEQFSQDDFILLLFMEQTVNQENYRKSFNIREFHFQEATIRLA